MKSMTHPSEEPSSILDDFLEAVGSAKVPLSYKDVFLPDAAMSPIFMKILNSGRPQPPKSARETFLSAWTWRFNRAKEMIRLLAPSPLPGPVEVVFWPREETHVDQMAPIIKLAKSRGLSHVVLATSIRAQDALTIYGIKAWDPTRLLKNEDFDLQSNLARKAIEQWDLNRLGPKEFCVWLDEFLPFVLKFVMVAEKVIEALRPKIIFVGNDLTPEGRATVLYAKSVGVITASIQHGNFLKDLASRHIVDKFFVFGLSGQNSLARAGLDTSRVTVTGAPYWESCISKIRNSGSIKKSLGLQADKPIVLIATSGAGHQISFEHHSKIVESIYAMSLRFPNLQFVCKLHRKDNVALYENMQVNYPASKVRIIRHSSKKNSLIMDLISICSVLVTGGSTSAVEALAMKKPVITLDYQGETLGTNFIEQGLTHHCRKPEDFETALANLSKLELPAADKVDEFLAQQFGPRDGRSSERIMEWIFSEIQGQRRAKI